MSLSFQSQEAKQDTIKLDSIPETYQKPVQECLPAAKNMKEGAAMNYVGEQSQRDLLSAPPTPSRSTAISQQIGT